MDHFFQELNVKLHTEVMGNDLCITISGGDRPHIGSIAIADPRKSLTGDGSTSATVSTYNFTGHKDYEVADVIALAVASKKNCRTVVVCVEKDGNGWTDEYLRATPPPGGTRRQLVAFRVQSVSGRDKTLILR